MIEINIDNISEGFFYLIHRESNHADKASTYYLAIDHDFMPDVEDTFKVLLNLKNVICLWIECIELVLMKKQGSVIYLPFDFQDEYIGFLRLEFLNQNTFIIDFGYSEELGGYSISPSKKRCLDNSKIKKFKVTSPNFEYDFDALLKDIKNMIKTIDNKLLTV